MKSRLLLTMAVGIGVFTASPGFSQDPQPEETISRAEDREAVSAKKFMIAAAHPLAVQVGYDILKRGGSATDAMIATQLVLNLVEPQSSGIGGGAFLLHWDAEERQLSSLDGREKAPMGAGPDYFLQPDGTAKGFWEAVVGGRSVGVPGTVALLEAAHKRHGKLPWQELFKPAIQLAEDGFEVSPRLAGAIAAASGAPRHLDLFPAARAYFFNEDGSPKQAGTILKNPAFAQTLRQISAGGARVFYDGKIAKEIVVAVEGTPDNPSVMTLEDLASYQVIQRPPVCQSYRVYNVCGMAPPSSGGLAVGQMLGVLEHFNLPGMGPGIESAHLIAEAGRLAFADRNLYVADSDYISVPTEGMLDDTYLTIRAQLIDQTKSMGTALPGNPPWRDAQLRSPDTDPERPGTSHIVVVDDQGNALSMTTTIETGFGSRVMVGGFLLNNEMTDFSRTPEREGRLVANRVEPGKRPRSSMAPTIVFKDDEPMLLVGSPGGSRIIGYVAQSIIAMLDWGLDPQEAVSLGHVVNRNGSTDLEQGTKSEAWQQPLQAMGHEVTVRDLNSGLHAIRFTDAGYLGGADPRREGIAMGE